MNVLIDSFLDYLRYERDYSEYTINAYFKDLQQFEDFVKEKKEGIFVPGEVDTDIVRNWIISLLDNKISPVSVNRKLSSLKSFFKFLMKQGFVSVNPLRFVTGPKTKKPLPTFVKEKDMEELLDGDGFDEDFEGVRDRLILEMLYDTGVRRSELVGLQDTDIDPRDPEYAGTQDHDDHRCQTLSECPGCRDRAVHERGDPIGKSHDRQALHSRCHDFRVIRK